jgi:hypothetical protein
MQGKEENVQRMMAMIEDWRNSGLNQQQFCNESNIRYHVFHYWYKRYRDKQEAKSCGFIPVQTMPVSSGFAEVHLSSGNRLILHQAVSAEYIKALID